MVAEPALYPSLAAGSMRSSDADFIEALLRPAAKARADSLDLDSLLTGSEQPWKVESGEKDMLCTTTDSLVPDMGRTDSSESADGSFALPNQSCYTDVLAYFSYPSTMPLQAGQLPWQMMPTTSHPPVSAPYKQTWHAEQQSSPAAAPLQGHAARGECRHRQCSLSNSDADCSKPSAAMAQPNASPFAAGVTAGHCSTPPSLVAHHLLDRKARVQRYQEKRKRRTFEKTIRYESRKAYAEVRPRIKGRFATRAEVCAMRLDGQAESESAVDGDADGDSEGFLAVWGNER